MKIICTDYGTNEVLYEKESESIGDLRDSAVVDFILKLPVSESIQQTYHGQWSTNFKYLDEYGWLCREMPNEEFHLWKLIGAGTWQERHDRMINGGQ